MDIYDIVSRVYNPGLKTKVLVLGVQKSGTTAIASLLSSYCGFSYANDPLHYYDKGNGKNAHLIFSKPDNLRRINLLNPKLFKSEIIKEPDFIFLLPTITTIYANASIVFVVRDPRDNIRSICNRLRLPGDVSSVVSDGFKMHLGNKHWELVLSGKLPNVPGNNFVEVLAHRWKLAAKMYLTMSKEGWLVRYEDFLKDKSVSIERMADFLGFKQQRDITSLLDIQFQPKGDNTATHLDFFGSNNLTMINDICGEEMAKFKYSP